MKVLEALNWANEKLKKNSDSSSQNGSRLESPMLDAEILLATALKKKKTWLFTHLDHNLSIQELDTFQKLIKKRSEFEPIAYITEEKEFYKRLFKVNRFVLIPRPDTEILIDEAINKIDPTQTDSTIFADIGTGSGAIAVTLAAETQLPVIATDISSHAVSIANMNAGLHKVEHLIDTRQGNLIEPLVALFKKLGDQSPFEHLIICANLPYITEQQWVEGQKELHYEPKIALTAGHDGLEAYWELFRLLAKHRHHLPSKVSVLIEIDPGQRNIIKTLITHDFPQVKIEVRKDYSDQERVVMTEI